MSRVIDPDKKLKDYTDDELGYALDRDMLSEEDALKASQYLGRRETGATGSASAEEEVQDEFTDMTVPELEKYAEDNDIDLGGAKRKGEIQKAIRDSVG
jgi:hypothetical protein